VDARGFAQSNVAATSEHRQVRNSAVRKVLQLSAVK
jgi:hypothetical protein